MKGLIRVVAAGMLMMLMLASFSGGRAMANKLAMPTGATVTVEQKNFQFSPKSVNINVGDTVTFVNKDSVEHTAQASDGSWGSGDMAAGASFSHTFTAAGTVAFYCKYHGSAAGTGMAGTIVVAQAAAGAAPTGGGNVTMPNTGSSAAVELWLAAMCGLLLIAGGVLLLKRRTV